MHAWPVHTTKLVAVHEASSYATCRLEQLGKPCCIRAVGQNLSGQVEIISQGSTYSDFQITVIVMHSM